MNGLKNGHLSMATSEDNIQHAYHATIHKIIHNSLGFHTVGAETTHNVA
jgi:predicted GNAT superfamily acetyltransferase